MTKIVCTACKGFGKTRSSGKRYHKRENISATAIDCGTVSVSLAEEGRILALVSGGQYSEGAPASVRCEILVDGARTGGRTDFPGEIAMDNTSLTATNGFARTAVSQQLPPGTHQVSLACSERGGDARLAAPTIAALAIPGEEEPLAALVSVRAGT